MRFIEILSEDVLRRGKLVMDPCDNALVPRSVPAECRFPRTFLAATTPENCSILLHYT